VDQVWATDITYSFPARGKAFSTSWLLAGSVLQATRAQLEAFQQPDTDILPGGIEIALTGGRKPQMFHSDRRLSGNLR